MIQLNYRDALPIYEQVRDGLRHLIVLGAMQAGEKLPSVRALAANLAINPNTIRRAYEELESEGYIYTMVGKGSFVAPRDEVKQTRRDMLLKQFDAAAEELIHLGLSKEELTLRI